MIVIKVARRAHIHGHRFLMKLSYTTTSN